jgi:hypothetical protein
MRKMKKAVALLYLILAPCLLLFVTIRTWHGFRDWTIDKGVVKIAGYTEHDAMRSLDWVDNSEDIPKARKEIKSVFNRYWTFYSNDDKAKKSLKLVFDKYGMLWEQ